MKRNQKSRKLHLFRGRLFNRERPLSSLSQRELIQRESLIGRELFGTVPNDVRREFFNTSPTVWIWHEEWKTDQGKEQLTTKYEVRDDGVWKVQPGPRYHKLAGDELRNFYQATQLYLQRVSRELYQRA